ncbi:hypothetical protein DFA_12051 [Cavenderia fasciculata]|uniref:Transmembrane protein n=1 Tax=Cavenderia fasciculata TaxID=261658 RepID=F4QFI0_CACFS|nr:uncharacterized protein DFA_12051 [Cavenderia fasciculata]EGG14281.1 hypothetical protein DFA_12051 [Cavenderia fasciculata]|eukprot:XP_004350990.1 hypothetical protein DFA_12051 [Cavenderia fasciculata]
MYSEEDAIVAPTNNISPTGGSPSIKKDPTHIPTSQNDLNINESQPLLQQYQQQQQHPYQAYGSSIPPGVHFVDDGSNLKNETPLSMLLFTLGFFLIVPWAVQVYLFINSQTTSIRRLSKASLVLLFFWPLFIITANLLIFFVASTKSNSMNSN